MYKNIIYDNDLVIELMELKNRSNKEIDYKLNKLSSESEDILNILNNHFDEYKISLNEINYFHKCSLEMLVVYNTPMAYSMEGIGKILDKIIDMIIAGYNFFIKLLKNISTTIMNFIKKIQNYIKSKFFKQQSEFYRSHEKEIKELDKSGAIKGIRYVKDFCKRFKESCQIAKDSAIYDTIKNISHALQIIVDKLEKDLKNKNFNNPEEKFDYNNEHNRAINEFYDRFVEKFNVDSLYNEYGEFMTRVGKGKEDSVLGNAAQQIRTKLNTMYYGQAEKPKITGIMIKEILTDENLFALDDEYLADREIMDKNLSEITKSLGILIKLSGILVNIMSLFKKQITQNFQDDYENKLNEYKDTLASKKAEYDSTDDEKKKKEIVNGIPKMPLPIPKNILNWLQQFTKAASNIIQGMKEYNIYSSTISIEFRNQVYNTIKLKMKVE